MSVGESLAPIFDKFFPGRNHEKALVSLEDLKVGVWKSKKGNIRVKSLEHPFDITDYSISDAKNQSLVVGSLEELRQKFEDGEYVFDESSVVPSVGEKIVNLAEVRATREGARQTEEQIDPAVENKKIQIDTEGAHTALLGESKKIFAILNEAEENPITEEMRTRATELFEQGETLYKEYTETEEGNGENQLISEDVLKAKRGRFEKIHAILTKMLALSLEVQELTKGKIEGKPRGSARAARRAAMGLGTAGGSVSEESVPAVQDEDADVLSSGAVNIDDESARALREALKTAPKFQEPEGVVVPPVVVGVAKGKSGETKAKKTAKLLTRTEPGAGDISGTGGPEGPKGPEDFSALLKARQEKVSALVDAITTLQGFAEFRRGMLVLPGKDSDGPKWYFIDRQSLEEELGKRVLTEEEQKQLFALEDFLKVKLRKKFFEMKDADVARFYDQEQAKVVLDQSETDLDALVASWPKQLEEIVTWKGLIDILTEVEKNKINESYDEVIGTLRQNVEIRRQELQMALAYQALDAFLVRSGGKEKIAMLQGIIQEAYEVYRRKINSEVGGRISNKEREELWRQKDGEQRLQQFVVNHLQVIEQVVPEEGEKIFRAMVVELQKNRS